MTTDPRQPEAAPGPEQTLDLSVRRSFSILAASSLLLALLGLIVFAASAPEGLWTAAGWRATAALGSYGLAIVVAGVFLLARGRRVETREQVTSAASALIVLLGALAMAGRLILQAGAGRDPVLAEYAHYAAWGAIDLIALHVLACMILPWSPRDSVIPFLPLLLLWVIALLVPQPDWALLDRVVGAIVSPVILGPGCALALWRSTRRAETSERMRLSRQVKSIGGELTRARVVHDAMFPKPQDTGHVLFDYIYVPMAEIGGDYVHFYVSRETGRTCMTLLDVAGHGLAAALTVNRLFGELERIWAEIPEAEPAEVMGLLNRYINLTMAPVNLYATGACILLNPVTGELSWVNAGHPPALVRRNDGTVEDLPGTTMLLGAEPYEHFQPNQRSMTLSPGQVVIAYTDGAYEARDRRGTQFGLEKMRETARFNPPPRSWTKFIANAVEKHHQGHTEDDVLIASLTLRSLRVAGPRTAAALERTKRSAERVRSTS